MYLWFLHHLSDIKYLLGSGSKVIYVMIFVFRFVERNDYFSTMWRRLKLSVNALFSNISRCYEFGIEWMVVTEVCAVISCI